MLYTWKSDYLARYGRGVIVVEAEDSDTAREKARAIWEAYDRENFAHNYLEDEYAEEGDEREIAERKRVFEADIAAEPETVDVLFVLGSD